MNCRAHLVIKVMQTIQVSMIPRYFMLPSISFCIAPADADTSSTKAYAELTELE